MTSFEVDPKAKFVAAWITYLATATGILRSLGVETDLVDVGGYTGYAFHINTAKGNTCPSAPTVAPFSKFVEGLECLGWKIEQTWEGPSYGPSKDRKELERAANYFSEIKDIIQTTGRPVGIWGIPEVPEFGIVNGFDDDKYLVSTFRGLPHTPMKETPISHANLHAPGGLFKMIFREAIEVNDDSVRDREAVTRAVEIAKGIEKIERYVAGPEAFGDWAHTLEIGIVPKSEKDAAEKKGITQLSYHGNSYVAQCTQEGLDLAAEFLKRVANRHEGQPFQKELIKASEDYRKAGEAMKEFTEIFPFSLEKEGIPSEFSDKKRAKGAKSLRKSKSHVESGIKQMEITLEKWE